MRLKTFLAPLLCGAAALGSFPGLAHAEVFLDVFAGKTWTTRTDLGIRVEDPTVGRNDVPVAVRAEVDGLNPRDSETFGARLGFWAGNLGFALDASTLDPTLQAGNVRATASVDFDQTIFGRPVSIGAGDDVKINLPELPLPTTATIAAVAMFRLPIGKTETRRQGIIQPYAFAGPVWLVTNERFDGKIGLRAGGGVKLPLGNNLGLFGEYRYTAVDGADVKAGRFTTTVNGVSASTGDIIGRIDIRTHALIAGASLSF